MNYQFDRFLRYAELTQWLQEVQAKHPALVQLSSYGKSHEGRDLWLVTITDSASGPADEKPAHWVDANIHATETTAGVAACYIIQHLVDGYSSNAPIIVQALKTRTFYVVPRVNPDGVELALADNPVYLRSSTRPWPWQGYRWPGILPSDVDGDGEVLHMRVSDPNGAWVPHPSDNRVMIPADHKDSPFAQGDYSYPRYRLLVEGVIENYDGFTIPTPRKPQGLDMNRNFPAGWGKEVTGSGDHPLSEPEINYLVRAIGQRPNICGYNAFHTAGGILLRPSSVKPDDAIHATDVWTWKEIGAKFTELTGAPVYSCYEDFTFDKKEGTLSGAADDFMYEHLGVFSWTTEFWDVVHAATGHRCSTKVWYLGYTVEEELAIAKWADANAPELYVPWRAFQHPQLGHVELGGPNQFKLISNPPLHLLKQEVAPHADFAVYQAMLSPKLEILMAQAEKIADLQDGKAAWRVKVGVANTGFLSTTVSKLATQIKAVLPVAVELASEATLGDGSKAAVAPLDGYSPMRQQVGQLEGRISSRIDWRGCDGTDDRALCVWNVIAPEGSSLDVTATGPRAGTARTKIVLKA